MAIQTIITQLSYVDEYSVLLGGPTTNKHYVQMDTVLVEATSEVAVGTIRFASDSIYTRPSSSSTYVSETLGGLTDSVFIGGDSTFELEFGEGSLPIQRKVKQVPHIASKKVYWS